MLSRWIRLLLLLALPALAGPVLAGGSNYGITPGVRASPVPAYLWWKT